MGIGRAPGKLILLGEHAVVFGQTALAAALPFGVTVEAFPAESGGIRWSGSEVPKNDLRVEASLALLARETGVEHAELRVTSELPVGGGLGSSAAFAVAVCRAFAPQWDDSEVNRISLLSERLFHGTPSGVDNAVCTAGGIITFRRGEPPYIERLRVSRKLPIVIGLTGRTRQTSTNVLSLRQRVEAEPERWMPVVERLGALAEGGAKELISGAFESIGARMDEAHSLLSSASLSSPELDEIVRAAKSAGALGAKLTGAGGGGAAIALTLDPDRVAKAIEARGFAARVVELG